MCLHAVVNDAAPGGMTGLGFLVLIPLSALGVIVAVGYGIMSVFSWWRARHGFPILAFSFALFNALVLTVETVGAVRSPGTIAAKAAFVAITLISVAVCVGLATARSPVRGS
jgi:hypothetical protein